jgi:nucleoside-diphosphate-sugar epimerase
LKTTLALISGATGWLGSRLAEILTKGFPDGPLSATRPGRSVRCLVMPGSDIGNLASVRDLVEVVRGDVTRRDTLGPFLSGAEGATLFHCAGMIHPRLWTREFNDVNVGGTRNLLDLARAAGVGRFVHVSSNSPCGCNPSPDHRFDEESPFNPYMGYGDSKMRAELEVRSSAGDRAPDRVIVRAPWFYGPNQPDRQTLFFRMIRRGLVPLVGDGENRRSMVYIDNLCQGLVLAEQVEVARNRCYWIADARPYTMNEIILTVERALEQELAIVVPRRRVRLPRFVGELATVADALLQSLGVYHQKIHVLSEMNKTIACSIDRAHDELGYAPAVELEEGMRRSIRWLVERGVSIG